MDGGVGAKLRAARLQRGLDLGEVEAATKIQARFLAAIENEEWGALPGQFYARSFVRSYAGYLGLEQAEVAVGLDAAAAEDERLPRIDPAPPRRADSGRRRHPSPRLLAALATLGLAAVLIAIGLSNLGDDSIGPSPTPQPSGAGAQGVPPRLAAQPQSRDGASLTLTATAEVWVCLLDARGQTLIDGQILGPGAQEGPYRSGGFTLSLGNGGVTMSVEGRAAPIPPTPNPIGFTIDRDGALRELPEAKRPTCT